MSKKKIEKCCATCDHEKIYGDLECELDIEGKTPCKNYDKWEPIKYDTNSTSNV